jgi:hypothetical protein
VPISDPGALVGLIGALTGDLDANHRLTRIHDRTDNSFDRLGQSRYAFANRASEMIFDGDAAYFSEALVDLQIAAVGRQECEANRRRIVDQLQGGLLRKRHAEKRCRIRCSRTASRFP